MFVRLFRIKASENLEKSLAGAIHKKEKWRNRDYLRMPKLQEIFTTVVIVCHCYERFPVLQMFSPLFCFELEKTLKIYSKKPYKVR